MQPDEIFKFIGQIVAYGGGAAAVAYLIFTWLGKNLMDEWFSKRLKQYDYQINSLFSRITKIHEKEFEILPEAWKKLQDAVGALMRLAQPLPSKYQDVSKMSDIELKKLLETLELSQREKEKLINSLSENRNNFLIEKLFQYNVDETQEYVNKFNNYLSYYKIFLSTDLFREFSIANQLLYLATHKAKAEGINSWETLVSLRKQIQETVTKIELLIQERLHYSDAK